jgi:hypothetical protein
MATRGKRLLLVLAGIASIVFAAIIGVSLFKFNQYRASALPIYPAPGHPQVSITSPAQGNQFALGAPIIVEATAFSASKITSIELYLGGALIGEQQAPSGGVDFFPAEFLFYPPEPGVYALIARANSVDELTTTSSAVQILITPPDFEPAAESDDSIALPALADPSAPSNLPLPNSDSNPAESWGGTPGNWINSLTADTPPDAPELAASLDGCSVTLSIHDCSDDEEGFEVWRLLPNSPSWSSIDVLASQSQSEWITTTDSGAHGETTYYVSAFNSAGVRDSNLISVNVDPVECAPPADERAVHTLKLESLETHITVDKLYCYVSLDGEQWMRRPEFGFWTRGDAAQGGGFTDVEILSLNLKAGDRSPESDPLTYNLQCWGWLGDALHYLGEFSPSLLPDQRGSYALGSKGDFVEVALNLEAFLDQPEFFPMGGFEEEEYEFGAYDEGMSAMDPSPFATTIDPTMPKLYPMVTHNPEVCMTHLPPPFQNLLGQIMFCFPYPGFDAGLDGANPQPYFIWNPTKHCMKGFGDPPCKPYPYWISLAADLGHEVGFNIYDRNSKGFYIHQVNTPELFNFVIPAVPCSGLREFWVQQWYYDGTTLLPTYGPPSEVVSIPCPYKLGPKMLLDIRFDMLRLYNVDDGEGGLQDVEVYGYLRASSGTMTRYLNLATWNEQDSNCPDDSVSLTLETSGGAGCPKVLNSGHYPLDDTVLCASKSYKNCSESGWAVNNNTIRLTVEESDALTLSVKIVDWDDASANDLVCEGTFQIPFQSIFEWQKIVKQPFVIEGALTDSGECRIEGVMNAVSP